MAKKLLLIALCFTMLLLCSSCNTECVPDDFSFSLRWGIIGASTYNSDSGKLVKDNDASDVSKYTAYVKLSEEQLNKVYDYLFKKIDITKYPEKYDPFNAPDAQTIKETKPNQTIIISVKYGEVTKTVSCEGIPLGDTGGYCPEAEQFLKSVFGIINILVALPEWEAFPEFEHLYS